MSLLRARGWCLVSRRHVHMTRPRMFDMSSLDALLSEKSVKNRRDDSTNGSQIIKKESASRLYKENKHHNNSKERSRDFEERSRELKERSRDSKKTYDGFQNSNKSQNSSQNENKLSIFVKGKQFKVNVATPQAIDCLRNVIERVFSFNRNGYIFYVDGKDFNAAPKKSSIEKVIRTSEIDLNEQGFMICQVSEENHGDHNETIKVPLVKLVPKKNAVNAYSQHIASIRAREMAEKSGKFARILNESKKAKNVSDSKIIKISWEISNGDLETKKRNEIESALKKHKQLMIVLDTKNALSGAIDLDQPVKKFKRPVKLDQLDLLKRDKTVALMKQILEEMTVPFKMTESGTTSDRLIFQLKVSKEKKQEAKQSDAKPEFTKESLDSVDIMSIDLSSIEDKKLLKEVRKRQRQEKQRRRNDNWIK